MMPPYMASVPIGAGFELTVVGTLVMLVNRRFVKY